MPFLRQIKPGILKFTIRRGQSNLSIVFTFTSCEEKGYYRVISVGQLGFDWRSYCGLSRRMQGQASSIKDLLYGFRGNFSCGMQRVVRSRQDSSILPVQVANHSSGFGSSYPLTELAT